MENPFQICRIQLKKKKWGKIVHIFDNCSILYSLSLYTSLVQLNASSRVEDGGAFCVASVGGK